MLPFWDGVTLAGGLSCVWLVGKRLHAKAGPWPFSTKLDTEEDRAFAQFDRYMDDIAARLNERDAQLAHAHSVIADLKAENDQLRGRASSGGPTMDMPPGDSETVTLVRYEAARKRVLRTLHPNATVGLPEHVRAAREDAFKEIWPVFDKA